MAVKTSKDIMDTNWYFQTPVYTIMKPEWLSQANKATDKEITGLIKGINIVAKKLKISSRS